MKVTQSRLIGNKNLLLGMYLSYCGVVYKKIDQVRIGFERKTSYRHFQKQHCIKKLNSRTLKNEQQKRKKLSATTHLFQMQLLGSWKRKQKNKQKECGRVCLEHAVEVKHSLVMKRSYQTIFQVMNENILVFFFVVQQQEERQESEIKYKTTQEALLGYAFLKYLLFTKYVVVLC
ncbi:CLUMA_CG010809, isoform A [Clunio marinus]|uniref:CLUMA_CG010809, isoform A n=1 Tax=Clunio marinus TaxID=568069 RepID=A0A1J1ICY7_9DIPT|nr:CLUMA_CG010809, isoform A [Clunio marinus]